MVQFAITFHGPFRVGTGQAGRGMDETVDRSEPLGASSLKGAMADAARTLLGLPADLHGRVFGTPRQPSPWAWSSAQLSDARVHDRAGVGLDPQTGSAARNMLTFNEEVWASGATFDVEQISHAGSPQDVVIAQLVLRAAGAAVTAIGADRRRGRGWVSITPDPALTTDEVARLLAMRS